jgi:hypothetical protein
LLSDFQNEAASKHNITLWTELRKATSRSGTFGSFPRINKKLDLGKLERAIRKQCGAITVNARIGGKHRKLVMLLSF